VSARPSAASISKACALTSALGGSMTSPKSQNGKSRSIRLVFAASKAPTRGRVLHPSTQSTARAMVCATRSASGWATRNSASTTSGRVVDVG